METFRATVYKYWIHFLKISSVDEVLLKKCSIKYDPITNNIWYTCKFDMKSESWYKNVKMFFTNVARKPVAILYRRQWIKV